MPDDKPKKTATTYRLSAETRQQIESIAKREERTFTSVIERAIREYFNRHLQEEHER